MLIEDEKLWGDYSDKYLANLSSIPITTTIKIVENNKIIKKTITYSDYEPLYSKGGYLYGKKLINGVWH